MLSHPGQLAKNATPDGSDGLVGFAAGQGDQFGVELDKAGNVKAGPDKRTSVAKVFTAGDMTRGQSLIVWAIAEGRSAAAAVDRYLAGTAQLPAPIPPTARPLT